MFNPLAALRLPRQGISAEALLTAAVVHVLLFWWALHGGQAVQATRQVVYQTFSPITPITPMREKPPNPPSVLASPVREPVKPSRPVPPLVVPLAEALAPAPQPVIQRMEGVTPPRAAFKEQELKAATDPRRTQVLPVGRLSPVAALPEPVVVEQLVPDASPPLVPTAPSPVPSNLPEATPGPVRAGAITPTEARPVVAPESLSGAGPGGGSVSPSSAGGMGSTGTNYGIPGGGRNRPKSVAEMANEQLNPGGRKDKFSSAVDASERPDCVNSGQSGGILAPAIVAYNMVRDKCK